MWDCGKIHGHHWNSSVWIPDICSILWGRVCLRLRDEPPASLSSSFNHESFIRHRDAEMASKGVWLISHLSLSSLFLSYGCHFFLIFIFCISMQIRHFHIPLFSFACVLIIIISSVSQWRSVSLQIASSLSFILLSWYHYDLSRHTAEALLLSNGADGSYLLRNSNEGPGCFALSVRSVDLSHHRAATKRHTLWVWLVFSYLLWNQELHGPKCDCFTSQKSNRFINLFVYSLI